MYQLTQTHPEPPPDHGGRILIGEDPGSAWWWGNNWEYGDMWWDDVKNAYELPSGDYLFLYPDGTWIRTDSQGHLRAKGTYPSA